MDIVLVLFIIAILAGIFGFGIANAIQHIAKFFFFLVVIILLIIFLYGYFAVHVPTNEETTPTTHEMIPSSTL